MKNEVLLVGIAGGSGSGKTTFAQRIIDQVKTEDIAILHMDSYYHPNAKKIERTEQGRPNFDNPTAFDWDLLRQHVKQLKQGRPIAGPVYNFHKSQREKTTVSLGPCRVVLFEGIFTLFDKDIRDMLDIKLFLHVDADIRFTRRLSRDVKDRGRTLESVIEQYYDSVRPMYLKYLSPQQQYADLVVGEETEIAASILAAKIKEFLLPLPAKIPQRTKVSINKTSGKSLKA